MTLQIPESELWILSNYAASELSGALILGARARQTDDDYIRTQCIWHCHEEMGHSLLWIGLIQKLGGKPLEVHDKEGDHYYARAGMPKSDIDLMSFVHVFERRVPFHLSQHAARPNIHPLVKKLIARLVQDEEMHLAWILKEIKKRVEGGQEQEMFASLERHAKIEQEVYEEYLKLLASQGGALAKFAEALREKDRDYDILEVIRADVAGRRVPQFEVAV